MGKKVGIHILIVIILVNSFAFIAYGADKPTLLGVQYGRSLYNNTNFSDLSNHWARGDIYRMAALSVVRGYGANQFRPEQLMTGQEAVSLILRQQGLEEEAQRLGSQQSMPGQSIADSWAKGYLDLAAREGLITEAQRYGRDWTTTAQIQDVIFWLAKGLELTPIYGSAQQGIFNFKDWASINPDYLPYLEAAYQRGLLAGDQNKYLHPQRSVKRGEIVSLLARIDNELLSRRGLKADRGRVEDISVINQLREGKTVNVTNYSVSGTARGLVNLVAENGSGSSDRNFPVYKNGRLGLSSLISIGDTIEYITNSNDEVLYVAVAKNDVLTLEGQVNSLSFGDQGNSLTVISPQGGLSSYPVASNAEVTVNNQLAKLGDLMYGQDVTLTISNGEVTKIGASLDGVTPGYITPGRRVVSGRVRSLWGDRVTIILPDQTSGEFVLASGAQIVKGGRQESFGSIKAGDLVKLHLDQVNTNRISKIEISGDEILVSGIYQGEIVSADRYGGKIILSNLQQYNHARWSVGENQEFLEVDKSTQIYFRNRLISLEELARNYRGSRAYIATTNYFGREKAVKIQIYDGYPIDRYGKLLAHDWPNNRLVVDNSQLSYGEGTIMVREGRLVDNYALNPGDGVFTSGDQGYYLGENSAHLVVVEGSGSNVGTRFDIYMGRIEWVRDSWYQLDDYYYYQLNNHEWQKINNNIILSINNGTQIVDASEAVNPQLVPVDKFMESQYSKKYTTGDSWSYWTYSVTDGQNSLGMVITKPGYWPGTTERISTARVKAVNRGENYLEVEQVKDWNSFADSWNINPSLNQITIDSAVIIKNGRALNGSNLNPGDQLYILREGSQGIIIIVE